MSPRETCDECGHFATELYYDERVRGNGLTAGQDGMICLGCKQKHEEKPDVR